MMIHPTAVIDPKAELARDVSVGPYAVIDGGVKVGPACRIGPHVHLTGSLEIGAGNVFHAGCVIGDAPQDLKYQGEPTRVCIGEKNTFREHVTVHRSNKIEEATVVGSHNFLMAHSHVGHNSVLGDHIILVNGALLGGHVTVADRALISGNCLIHQFVRIGTFALMQGRAGIGKDLPPFTVARGVNHICGLNSVGLRRAGFDAAQRLELKKLYRFLFRSHRPFRAALQDAEREFKSPAARVMIEFLAESKRGVCSDTGTGETEDDND